MNDPRVNRLVVLSGLIRDHRLARLSAAVARREATIGLRDSLEAASSDDPAALRAQAVYGIWVERQREALTRQLDQQTAEVEAELGTARMAFARAAALAKLRDQLS